MTLYIVLIAIFTFDDCCLVVPATRPPALFLDDDDDDDDFVKSTMKLNTAGYNADLNIFAELQSTPLTQICGADGNGTEYAMS
jgi:hypothetical protein